MLRFVFAAVAATCLLAMSNTAMAQFPQGNAPNPLFSQYVTQGAGNSSAAMYPAPHWSPNLGAQSNYTYQPLMPHEMMYQHSRNYYNYYNDGGYYGGGNGLVKTSVRWQAGANHMGPLPFSTSLAGIGQRINSRRYCLGGNCGGGGIGGGGIGAGIRGGGGRLLRGGCASGDCGH
jgi:hypothetical protein